jgi:3-hydroxyisobutyrate dehydrogenase-like beta-hydroxyacid dehydrogenase
VERIGFVGLGIMGSSMAANLRRAGYELMVYNRTRERAAAWAAEHDYSTLFNLEHMLKDVRLCLEEGQAAGVPFPAAAEVREALTAGMGGGLGDDDFVAVVEVVEGLAGIRL